MSFSLSANRDSASLQRLSKSSWIWLSCFRRVMRLSWKTLKFVNGFVSPWPCVFCSEVENIVSADTVLDPPGMLTGVLSTPRILSMYW